MKEESQIGKKAEEKQTEPLSTALGGTSNAGGHWLNVSGRGFPRLYPRGILASPFNALFMALHSDNDGCKTNLFTLYSETKVWGAAVREHKQGVPLLLYNWNKYINRNDLNETIDRATYLQLDEEQRARFKSIYDREIRTLFSIDQATLSYVDKLAYEDVVKQDGSAQGRRYAEADNRRLRTRLNDFLLKMRDDLVPARPNDNGIPHYKADKDAVCMPRQKNFEHHHDYVQEALRQIVSVTGHQQRLAREDMVMKDGVVPLEDAVKYERLVVELTSGIRTLELGLPARLPDASLKAMDYWCREFKENPYIMDALENNVNNALDVIQEAEWGEKIGYAIPWNRRQITTMQKQIPEHYFMANEVCQYLDKAAKNIVLVIDRETKSVDVILPTGASTGMNNEIPGTSKGRVEWALRKKGTEQVRFYSTDGVLGYRPDDSYFSEKTVTLVRLRNYTSEKLSTLDMSEAIRRMNKVGFNAVQMIQDDKNHWALYIKSEDKEGYNVYPNKEDVNRFFSTLKQAVNNIDRVRMGLVYKYYALAEVEPDLKVGLFGSDTSEINLNHIQRVAIFKTRQDGI